MQVLMDIVNKQQLQIAELVKSQAGQVSQSLMDEVNDTERLAHHQQQVMCGLAATHANCLQLERIECWDFRFACYFKKKRSMLHKKVRVVSWWNPL